MISRLRIANPSSGQIEHWIQNNDLISASPLTSTGQSLFADVTVNGSLAATAATAEITLAGMVGCAFSLAGTWVGTAVAETFDGTTWTAQPIYLQSATALVTNGQMTANQAGLITIPAGSQKARIRFQSRTSGTITVILRASAATTLVQVDTSLSVYGGEVVGRLIRGFTSTSLTPYLTSSTSQILQLVGSTVGAPPDTSRRKPYVTIVSVTTTAVRLLQERLGVNRQWSIRHADSSGVLYWNNSSLVSATNGWPLLGWEEDGDFTTDEVWAVASTGTISVAVKESWDA